MNTNIEKMAEELLKLKDLKDSGILTDSEFEEQKAILLKSDMVTSIDGETNSTLEKQQEGNSPNVKELFSKIGKIELTRNRKIAIIAVIIIALILGAMAIQGPILTGDDKIAYELILDASKQFKSPSSVRVVSGTVYTSEGESVVWCGISAINGFGARSTSYYYINEDGDIMETDYDGARRQDLNVDRINNKLEKRLRY